MSFHNFSYALLSTFCNLQNRISISDKFPSEEEKWVNEQIDQTQNKTNAMGRFRPKPQNLKLINNIRFTTSVNIGEISSVIAVKFEN